MTVPGEKATATYGPAAAVIRRRHALCADLKSAGLNLVMGSELIFLSAGEESGIPSVAVKCVDIGKNTSGEGGLLDGN